jgi:hypothetical protein
MMGYVQPTSLMKQLGDPDPEVSRQAAKEMVDGYNRYREGMRSGLFGLLIGRAMFPASKDRKL